MREIIGRIYGIGSVNVSVNRLRHVARSSIETVYVHSKRKNYKPDFLQLAIKAVGHVLISALLGVLAELGWTLAKCHVHNRRDTPEISAD